MTMNHLSG
jgi:hypothetical protein